MGIQWHCGVDAAAEIIMTKITPREPLDDRYPNGYMESDRDYVLKNIDACVEFLDSEVNKEKIPSYYCQTCFMPPHNCLCSHDD